MRKPPPKLTDDELKAAIWSLPAADRIALLAMSILDRDKSEPLNGVMGLIGLISRLSQYFPEDKRWLLAEKLRTAADNCEKPALVE